MNAKFEKTLKENTALDQERILTNDDFMIVPVDGPNPQPTENDMKKHQDLIDAAASSNRKLVKTCCQPTIEILKGALEIGLSQTEFDVFFNAFHGHRFDLRAMSKTDILTEIFETAEVFKNPKLATYFLDSAKNDVERDMKGKVDHATNLLLFNKGFDERLKKRKKAATQIALAPKQAEPPTFESLFVGPEAMEKAMKAAREVGLINEAGIWIFGERKKAGIVAFWEELRSKKPPMVNHFVANDACQVFAAHFQTSISERTIRGRPAYYEGIRRDIKSALNEK